MHESVMPPGGIPGLIHPLDVVEEAVASQGWPYERDEQAVEIDWGGSYGSYLMNFNWIEEQETLHLVCTFELKVPPHRIRETRELVRLINERAYTGNFEVWDDSGMVLYRYGLMLPAGTELTLSQCNLMAEVAGGSVDYYYQAFQFVVWAGKSAKDALEAVQFETEGNA